MTLDWKVIPRPGKGGNGQKVISLLTAWNQKSIFSPGCNPSWLSKPIALTFTLLERKMRGWGCQKMSLRSL
jgi:hypothetical protein